MSFLTCLIWDVNLVSGEVWWSESLLTTFGYDPEGPGIDWISCRNWIHPDEREPVVSSLARVIESGESNWNSEYRFICADGRTLDVVSRGIVLSDESGKPIRVIGITTDVTELRILEQKLRQAQNMEAVGQLTGGMNGKQLADAARLRRPALKVLFTSGYTEDAIVHQGRLDPGVVLLGKPYRRAELVAKVRQVLDGGWSRNA